MRGIFKVVVSIAVLSMFAGVAPARAVDLANKFVAGIDLGLYEDPDLAAVALSMDYHVTENVAFGPYLSLGFDVKRLYFSTSGIVKYKANLSENAKLKPYGMVGVGFISRNRTRRNWENYVTKPLFPVGAGFEYWFRENTAWGANLVYNVCDKPFFSLFAGFRIKF